MLYVTKKTDFRLKTASAIAVVSNAEYQSRVLLGYVASQHATARAWQIAYTSDVAV